MRFARMTRSSPPARGKRNLVEKARRLWSRRVGKAREKRAADAPRPFAKSGTTERGALRELRKQRCALGSRHGDACRARTPSVEAEEAGIASFAKLLDHASRAH